MNQFFVMAIAEKVSALKTAEYFAARAKIASPRRAADILRKVADRPPETDDEVMPALAARQTRATYAVRGAIPAKRTASSRKRTRR